MTVTVSDSNCTVRAPVFGRHQIRHLRALRKSPWKFIVWMNELQLHCMLVVSYTQQYFDTSITVLQGRVQDFHLGVGGGGGAKGFVPARTLRARNRTHFRQGSRAHLRALEAYGLETYGPLGLFECYLVQ